MQAPPLASLEEPLLPPGTRHFIVVYQLGKVASTSLVASLSEIQGVVAVQSHFLGLKAFSGILGRVVDPRYSDYFARHALAQLNANVSIERTIAAVRARMHPGIELTLLSLSREPLDWFRSSIAQDIQGYRDALRALAEGQDLTDDDAVISALPRVCDGIASALEACGGIDEFLQRAPSDRNAILSQSYGDRNPRAMNEFLFRFLRPFNWFEEHFGRYLGIPISSLGVLAPQVYREKLGAGARAYVIRYEDIAGSMPVVLADAGIDDPFNLVRENVSEEKSLSDAVRGGIAAAPLDRLRALSRASSYAQQFGYAA